MKYIVLILFTFSTNAAEITHDYVLNNAYKACKNHQGFHYIVTKTKWLKNDKNNRYPCERKYIVSCQDSYKEVINSEVSYCFISKMQIDESLKELNK